MRQALAKHAVPSNHRSECHLILFTRALSKETSLQQNSPRRLMRRHSSLNSPTKQPKIVNQKLLWPQRTSYGSKREIISKENDNSKTLPVDRKQDGACLSSDEKKYYAAFFLWNITWLAGRCRQNHVMTSPGVGLCKNWFQFWFVLLRRFRAYFNRSTFICPSAYLKEQKINSIYASVAIGKTIDCNQEHFLKRESVTTRNR